MGAGPGEWRGLDILWASGFPVERWGKDGEATKCCVWFPANKAALCSVRLQFCLIITGSPFLLLLIPCRALRLAEIGRFQEPKIGGKYEPGQVGDKTSIINL